MLVLIVLWDGFETVVLPRRVTRKVRLARLFIRYTWIPWSTFVTRVSRGRRQETLLSYYGPLSLLLLLAVWAFGLITGFALIHWGAGSDVAGPGGAHGLGTDFYFSGTTFFTLGLGDVTPHSNLAMALAVTEAGIGFGFLALVIGYLPALNQSFSRRERNMSLLDARAGSPSTAGEMLRRHGDDDGFRALQQLLYEWERWAAELLESHLSFPVLTLFRSQHDNQSWLAAMTAMLDTSALVIVGLEGACVRQAQLTFAVARHAIIDLSYIFRAAPMKSGRDRLPPEDLAMLRGLLASSGLRLQEGEEADRKLAELRAMYEPYVRSLSKYLHMSLPPWLPESHRSDNWQTSGWEPGSGKPRLPGEVVERHF